MPAIEAPFISPDADYWRRVELVGRDVFENREIANVDEQAGPAYFAGLPLSRWLFWRRLRQAVRHIPEESGQTCIDFGCGFGLLLPWLAENFDRVIGVDLVPDLSRRFLENYWLHHHAGNAGFDMTKLELVEGLSQVECEPGSVDLIVALDVLEHVEDRRTLIAEFAKLLSPQGCVLISGPTESWWYRLGRKIVGFSGDYHVCDVYDVGRDLEDKLDVEYVARVPSFPPLFEILRATPR